jgi:hypothetical protein
MNLSFITWSPTEVETLIKLVEKGLSAEDISAELTEKANEGYEGYLTPRSVRAVQRKKQKIFKTTPRVSAELSTGAQWDRIRKIQKQHRTDSKFDTTGVLSEPGGVKILSLSDIHFPFAHVDFLQQAIDKNKDADILVLNGDILDGFIHSTFEKESTVAAIDEYNCAADFVALCAGIFPHVVITYGNHDARAEKALKRTGMPKEAYKIFGPNLLARIANGERLDSNGMVIEKRTFSNVFFPTSEPWWVQIGKTLFIHPHNKGSSKPGHTVNGWAGKFRGRLPPGSFDSIVCGHCFDDETEILTQRGWLFHHQLNEDDYVGTMNKHSNLFEWNHIEAIWRYDYEGELIAFGEDDRRQVLVTPEHGMVWRSATDKSWRYNQAKDIAHKSQIEIPTALFEHTSFDFAVSDDQLKLIAWIITEGSIDPKRTNMSVRLHQSDDGGTFCKEIDSLLKNLNIVYSKSLRYKGGTVAHGQHRNYDAYRWYLNVKDTKWISLLLNKDKTFNQEMLVNLSYRQREILIQELCKGDGSKCGSEDYRAFYNKNQIIIDQVQILLTLNGYSSNYKYRKDGTAYLSFKRRDKSWLANPSRKPYKGKVFCLTTPNGTLVARRRGWTFVTQNTHHAYKGISDGMLLIEQGCLSDYMSYAWSPATLYLGNAAQGYAVVYQDEDGNTDFNTSGFHYFGQLFPIDKPIYNNKNLFEMVQ